MSLSLIWEQRFTYGLEKVAIRMKNSRYDCNYRSTLIDLAFHIYDDIVKSQTLYGELLVNESITSLVDLTTNR
jgi:hypothetical protein